jgi:hypothetical protein
VLRLRSVELNHTSSCVGACLSTETTILAAFAAVNINVAFFWDVRSYTLYLGSNVSDELAASGFRVKE